MKKRMMSLFLTLSLCVGLTVPAFAAGTTVALPKLADEPHITLTLSNVLDTYTIPLTMEDWVDGELVLCEKDTTVYRLSESGSYFAVESDGQFDLFPGGLGCFVLKDGKYVPDAEEEYFGQMAYLSNMIGRSSMEIAEQNKDKIYAFYYGETIYFTHADLSAYDVKAEEPVPAAPVVPEVPVAPEKPAAPAFSDVSAAAYYAESVKWAVENGVTAGTSATTFSPDSTCTNAQILTFMWRAAGSPEPAAANPFSNLTGEEYYAKAAAWAFENGMVSGPVFDGDKACTRAMTMEYFWKQAGSPATAVSDKFTDVAVGDSYAQAVAWAVENGVTAGVTEDTFVPDQTCTRGHIVTFLYRALM